MLTEPMFGSDIELGYPDVDFFTNKIEKNEYFTFMKWNHGVWDLIFRFHVGLQLQLPSIVSEEYLFELSKWAANDGPAIRYNEGPEFFFECFKIMTRKKPPYFLSGVSCKANRFNRGSPSQREIIKKFTENETKPLIYGEIWKMYALQDIKKQKNKRIFHNFIQTYKDRIIFFGPDYYCFVNFLHKVTIPKFEASKPQYIQEICDEIHKFYKPGIIVLFSAGLVGTYVSDKIHNELSKVFYIDMGLASQIYSYQKD